MQKNSDVASVKSWFYSSSLILSLSFLALFFRRPFLLARMDMLSLLVFVFGLGFFCLVMGFNEYFIRKKTFRLLLRTSLDPMYSVKKEFLESNPFWQVQV